MKTRDVMLKTMKKPFILGLFTLLSFPLFGQSPEGANQMVSFPIENFYLLATGLCLMAFVVIYIALVLWVKTPEVLSVGYVMDSITGNNSSDKLLEHGYDGIYELDNPMPAWLRMILWGSVIWGGFYLLFFHVWKVGDLQEAEFKKELAVAEAKYSGMELTDDRIVLSQDRALIEKGKSKFKEMCATCHGDNGEGKSGPNLTDAYWLHGGDIKSIYKVITEGVAGKAMISWKNQINSNQRLALSNFILSLQGTKPANGLPPEGVLDAQRLQPASAISDSSQTEILDSNTTPKP